MEVLKLKSMQNKTKKLRKYSQYELIMLIIRKLIKENNNKQTVNLQEMCHRGSHVWISTLKTSPPVAEKQDFSDLCCVSNDGDH